ncbi:MAG TPA: serine/threonine-protein kinase, partial [Kofleriaceae bacterium]|nr:serine/threonine-protein kinase [Kofleriaceae bacterium]
MGKLEIVYAAGARIAGKYRVERILGSGGMGVVVAAEHEELRSRVALKFLAPELAQRADVVERFLREARVCAQLRSEHVCRVSDFGRLETGAPYIVMEMLDGLDLANVLAANGALAVPTIASYIVQACDALAEAHAAGIVHRDLKPANLFLARRRDGGALIKVLDFGVAKIQGPRDHALTRTDMIVGSPLYMAPEQFGSALAADARSDIWSLGVILYELAAGRPPFTGPAVDIAFQIDREPAPRLTGVPDGFARAVARCLDKAPERRFQRIADLVAALRPFLPRDADTTIRGMSGNPDEVSDRSTLRMTPQQLRARPGKPGAPAGAPLPGVAPSPSAPSPEAAYPEGTPPLMKAQVADAAIASFVLRGDTHEVTGPARGA